MTTKTDIREETKEKALEQLIATGRTLIEGATGVGKTKMSLDLVAGRKYQTIVVLVPTDTVADSWDKDIEKWYGAGKLPILTVNYRSSHKLPELFMCLGTKCIILDECHHITDLNLESLLRVPDDVDMIALSATVDQEKFELLERLNFKKGIRITTDQAVENDLIVNYKVSVIEFEPDSVQKVIECGKKGEKFMTTEADNLRYLEYKLNNAKRMGYEKNIQFAILQRMHFIKGLPSRINIAKKIIAKIKRDNPSKRLLIFAPTMKVAEELCPECYIHSKSGDEMFNDFVAGKFNHLSSVNMLSEGVNVQADMILVLSSYYKERSTVQQLGRVLRKGADGKEGAMIILCATGTQDEVWVKNSTANLRNVKRFSAKTLGFV